MNLVRLYLRALAFLGPEARRAWFLGLAGLALAAAQLAEPVLFGRIIDTLVKAQGSAPSWPSLTPLLGAWVGFGLFTIVCGAITSLHSDRLAHQRRHGVLTDYFEHILQLPLSYHGGHHSGRLLKVMLAGTDSLWWLWLSFFREHLVSLVSIIVLLPLALYLNWRLALILIALCVVFTALTALVLRKAEGLQGTVESHYSDLAERTSDAVGNVSLVQSFTRVEAEVAALRAVVSRLLGAQMPVLSWWALAAVLTRASVTLTLLSIFVVGIRLHIRGLATIGDIVMFTNFAGMVISRLEQMIGFVNRVFLDAPRLREFFAVLDTIPAVRDRPDAIDPGSVAGRVEFDHVSFSYDGERPAISDLSFEAQPGETVALVGPTGAGKSSALNLLHRVFDPQSGSVKVDGMDIRSLRLAALRRNIGVVFQEALLLNRSIGENLRVGKPEATEAEMRDACRRAQALDFIETSSEGFAAPVGERGRLLSGGERQRVSIARALLKDPPILILDEATSALDAATEAKVQTALGEVMKGRTTFVIAHRLATVRNADCILVFEGGSVIEAGTFDELIRRGGRFRELAEAQFMVHETDAGFAGARPRNDRAEEPDAR